MVMVEGDLLSRILGTVILIAIIALPIFLIVRRRNSSWTGVVTDKKIVKGTDDDGNPTESFVLIIKKDGAEKAHARNVSAANYNKFAVNDKIEKKAGKFRLEKI